MQNAQKPLDQLHTPESLEILGKAHDEHDRKFLKGIKAIDERFQKLPKRGDHSDEINATHDAERLALILHCLNYLKIYTNAMQETIQAQTSSAAKEHLSALALTYKRQLFLAISHVIFNASGEFRGKYKSYLSPAPFSWETFEHFGAIMINNTEKSVAIFQDSMAPEIIKNVKTESYNKELIVEAAVDKIIATDLDKLISFFKMIKEHHVDKNPDTELKKYQFFSIKAITKRVLDTVTFMNLLSMTNNSRLTQPELKKLELKPSTKDDFHTILLHLPKSSAGRYVEIDKKVKIHAALRRLEMIGELLTGKYFSAEWKTLDESIDWNAIITLRDRIAHQDEGDNHDKMNRLLADKDLLAGILETDIPYLHHRLQVICARRYGTVATYTKGQEVQFCENLVTKEIELFERANAPKPPEVKVKMNKEEREKKRQDDQDAAAARQKAITDKFQGLDFIRRAAQIFTQEGASSNAVLNPKKRVQLALDALVNIVELLKTEASIRIDRNTDSKIILNAIYKNEFLYDAINYNIEQFLTHLERIKDYEIIKDNPVITMHYESLRYMRNHIAHGALLLDMEEYRPGNALSEYTSQQRQVAVIIRVCVIGFPSDLRKAMDKIDARQIEALRAEKNKV